jgi:hypothetical protein
MLDEKINGDRGILLNQSLYGRFGAFRTQLKMRTFETKRNGNRESSHLQRDAQRRGTVESLKAIG